MQEPDNTPLLKRAQVYKQQYVINAPPQQGGVLRCPTLGKLKTYHMKEKEHTENLLIMQIIAHRKEHGTGKSQHDITKSSFEDREDALTYLEGLGLFAHYDERTNLLTVETYE